MSEAERLIDKLWTAEHEDKNSVVDGKRRKEVWQKLLAEVRRLASKDGK